MIKKYKYSFYITFFIILGLVSYLAKMTNYNNLVLVTSIGITLMLLNYYIHKYLIKRRLKRSKGYILGQTSCIKDNKLS